MNRPASPMVARGLPSRSYVRFHPSGRSAVGWTFMLAEMGATPAPGDPPAYVLSDRHYPEFAMRYTETTQALHRLAAVVRAHYGIAPGGSRRPGPPEPA